MTKRNCPEEQQLTLFCSGDLDTVEQQAVARHLAICPACQQSVNEIQQALGNLPRIDLALSPAEQSAFAARITEAVQGKQRAGNRYPLYTGLATAASALIALLVFQQAELATGPGPETAPRLADFELVEQIDMLENLELLESLEMLEMLDDNS